MKEFNYLFLCKKSNYTDIAGLCINGWAPGLEYGDGAVERRIGKPAWLLIAVAMRAPFAHATTSVAVRYVGLPGDPEIAVRFE